MQGSNFHNQVTYFISIAHELKTTVQRKKGAQQN